MNPDERDNDNTHKRKETKNQDDNIENIELMIDGILKEEDEENEESFYSSNTNNDIQRNSLNINQHFKDSKSNTIKEPIRENKFNIREDNNLMLDLNAKPFQINNPNNRLDRRNFTEFPNNNIKMDPNLFQYPGNPNSMKYNNILNLNKNMSYINPNDQQFPGFYGNPPFRTTVSKATTNFDSGKYYYNINTQNTQNTNEYDSNNSNMSNFRNSGGYLNRN